LISLLVYVQVQLGNADKLIGGLGGEEARWRETVTSLTVAYNNILGDVIISAATISYLGPFTAEFRNSMVSSWQQSLVGFKLPHTNSCNLEVPLASGVLPIK
jgi:dynein heavy chain